MVKKHSLRKHQYRNGFLAGSTSMVMDMDGCSTLNAAVTSKLLQNKRNTVVPVSPARKYNDTTSKFFGYRSAVKQKGIILKSIDNT